MCLHKCWLIFGTVLFSKYLSLFYLYGLKAQIGMKVINNRMM